MLWRLLKGSSPLSSDREHVHPIFERAGFSGAGTAYIFAVVAFAMGGIGVGAWRLGVPGQWLWPPLLSLLVLQFMLTHRAWRAMRLLRRVRALGSAPPPRTPEG